MKKTKRQKRLEQDMREKARHTAIYNCRYAHNLMLSGPCVTYRESVSENGETVRKTYVKRIYRGPRSAYLKKQSSRHIRRLLAEDLVHEDFRRIRGGSYKRLYDYWHEIW